MGGRLYIYVLELPVAKQSDRRIRRTKELVTPQPNPAPANTSNKRAHQVVYRTRQRTPETILERHPLSNAGQVVCRSHKISL